METDVERTEGVRPQAESPKVEKPKAEPPKTRKSPRLNRILGAVLTAYLLVTGVGAIGLMIYNFPSTEGENRLVFKTLRPAALASFSTTAPEQGLLLLALMAGIAGSFLHAAQSLASYLGNVEFKPSWTTWYLLRPWIGGTLGVAIYLAFRAGIVMGAGGVAVTDVDPFFVTGMGLLGGWFSKTTTDKLQEVFGTLFQTNQDELRKNKLRAVGRPTVGSVEPSPVPGDCQLLVVRGTNFIPGASVLIGDQELTAKHSTGRLEVDLTALAPRPSGTTVSLRVKLPEGVEPLSKPRDLTFS